MAMLVELVRKPFIEVKLLDFGAGTGRYLEMFAEQIPKGNLCAAEADSAAVRRLKGQGYPEVIEVSRERASLAQVPDESFDVVFSSNVLEHIAYPSYRAYLSEFYRVLIPGGVFLVGMPNYHAKRFYDMVKAVRSREHWRYYVFDDPTHINKRSIREAARDIKIVFDDVRLFPTFGFLDRYVKPIVGRIDHCAWVSIFCDKYFGFARKRAD